MRRVLIPPQLSPQAPPVGAVVLELHGLTMGTNWSVKLAVSDRQSSQPAQQTIQQGIQHTLDEVVRQMSTWEPDSVLSAYNRAPANTWVEVPAEFLFVLSYALEVAELSEGAFDPTAGPLVNLWGFGPEASRTERPDATAITAARARLGWRKVQIDRTHRLVLQPGDLYLDFSAIAKGFGVDQLSRYLHSIGIDNHLVEVGGELRGSGMKPDAMPWWVELELPLTLDGGTTADVSQNVIALHGLSIATSGDYRKYFEAQDARYSHTIDPRSGEPINNGVAAVTVVHRDCITADAVSTALNVLGHEQGLLFANQHHIPALFVVRNETGFSEYQSEEFKALLQ